MGRSIAAAAGILALSAASLLAHVSPVVVLHKQADVIRSTLPGAVQFQARDVRPGKAELKQIIDRTRYTPNTPSVRFYQGHDASGRLVGTVLFPQADTQHGPIEVGVTIAPDGTVTHVTVTRSTAEMKPWILELERSGALAHMEGTTADTAPASPGNGGGMTGYVGDVIARTVRRALVINQVLSPAA